MNNTPTNQPPISAFDDLMLEPVDERPSASNGYRKLELSREERSQFSALLHEAIPAGVAMSNGQLYQVRFPEGLPQQLLKLKKQPGYSSTLVGADQKFAGTASLIPASGTASVMGVYHVLSVITSQEYLHEINSQMNLMNQKLDDILDFLYGDKKAELLANLTFIRNVAQNFSSIVSNSVHCMATLSSLQQAQITAMNDIEFYLSDLADKTRKSVKSVPEARKTIDSILQAYSNLKLSQQLHVMSVLLEVYYAQISDPSHLNYLKEETSKYLSRCSKTIQTSISKYAGRAEQFKGNNGIELFGIKNEQISEKDLKPLYRIIDELTDNHRSSLETMFADAMSQIQAETEYFINSQGEVYIRAEA